MPPVLSDLQYFDASELPHVWQMAPRYIAAQRVFFDVRREQVTAVEKLDVGFCLQYI